MAQIKADEITEILREQIENYGSEISVDEVGAIISVGDRNRPAPWTGQGHGRRDAGGFPGASMNGLAMNLEEDQVGCMLLGDYHALARRRSGEAPAHEIIEACRSAMA